MGCLNEKCNLNSNDNEIEILIRQLKREIKKMMEDTTTKLLMQDGKIAETCVYIKNNLSNNIRDLLDTMKFSGELDSIITETILNSISVLQKQVENDERMNEEGVTNLEYPYGHVRRYGAKGDGISDDTEAIKKAAKNAIKFGFPLLADEGNYLLKEDIDFRYISKINFEGDIITENQITVGNSSAVGSGCIIKFGKLKSLLVLGLKNSIIEFRYVDKITLRADGDDSTASSIAYTTFSGAYCKEIVFESSGNAIGWINENVFNIKRVESIKMGGNYPHNNNHFEHCNLEKGKVTFLNARNNHISARCEGGITIEEEGEETQANFIEKEYYYRHYFGNDLEETSKGTVSFYPVQKLQTEKELLKIDSDNRSFPIGSLYFNENNAFHGVTYNEIFRSNFIKIENTFALKMKASGKAMRIQFNLYDENKNIITDADNFADGKIAFVSGSDWNYVINTNVDNDTVVFYPGKAKYVKYRVIFGDNAEDVSLEYVNIKLIKYINTYVNVSNEIPFDVYTSVPTSGFWKRGKILYAKNPTQGTNLGVVCVSSGMPGTWKTFAPIGE